MNKDQAWVIEWVNHHVYPMMKVSDRMDVRRITAKMDGSEIRIEITFNNGTTKARKTKSIDDKRVLQLILDAV